MNASKDYYGALGVLPTIDEAALTAVCRALLKKHHPDVAAGDTTDGRATDIIEAYRVLGDAEQRRKYDAARREIVRKAGPVAAPAEARGTRTFMLRLATYLAIGFGLRVLVSTAVTGALALSPVGTRLIDALAPLAAPRSTGAPAAAGGSAFAGLFSQPAAAGHDVVRHVANPGVSADAAPAGALPVIRLGDEAARPNAGSADKPSSDTHTVKRMTLRRPRGEASLFRALYGDAGAR